jgi:hypothetical protein
MFKQKIRTSRTTFSSEITEKFYTRNENMLINLYCHQEKYVELLHEYPESTEAQALAMALSKCAPNARCRSVACAYCYRAARRFFARQRKKRVSALLKAVRPRPNDKPENVIRLVKDPE